MKCQAVRAFCAAPQEFDVDGVATLQCLCCTMAPEPADFAFRGVTSWDISPDA